MVARKDAELNQTDNCENRQDHAWIELWLAKYSPALEERNVEDWRVEVQELKNEHFEDEAVLELGKGSWKLCKEDLYQLMLTAR